MLAKLRRFAERALIGDSVPALVRWGKLVPPSLVRSIQLGAFGEMVRYAARHQKFFGRKLR